MPVYPISVSPHNLTNKRRMCSNTYATSQMKKSIAIQRHTFIVHNLYLTTVSSNITSNEIAHVPSERDATNLHRRTVMKLCISKHVKM